MNIPRLPYREDRLFGWLFAAVLLVPLVFSLFTYEDYEIFKFALMLVFTGAGILAVVVKTNSQGRALRANKVFYWFLGLFWLWTLLATLFAWDKNYSFFGFYPRFTSGFVFYSAWAVLIFLLNLLDWEQTRFLLKILVLTSGLVALWGIFQSVGIGFYSGLNASFLNRAAPSFLGNTDFSSMYVVAVLPLAIMFFLRSNKYWYRVYYGLSAFIQLVSLFIFASRGALVALAAALLLALILMVRFSKGKTLVLALAVAFLIVIGGGLGVKFLNISRPQAFQSILSVSDVNTQNRLAVWKLSLGSIIRRPVFGVGLGNFQLMFEHDRPGPIISSGFFDDAHNLPLELAVSGGVFLALWFFCLIATAAVSVWKGFMTDNRPEGIALLSALAGWLVASLFTPVAIPCYVLLAVLLSAAFRQGLGEVVFKPAIRGAAAVIGAVLLIWGLVFFSAEILFYQGAQSFGAGNYQKAYKLTAIATGLNPFNRLYYVFLTGSAIESNQSLARVQQLLRKTQSLDSKRAYGYVELANLDYLLLYRTRDLSLVNTALGNAKKAVMLDLYSSNDYFSLSAFQMAFGDLAGAQASARTGLSLDPNYEQGEIFLAKTYQLQNNKQEMLAALSRASKINPNDLEVLKFWHAVQLSKNVLDVPFNVNLGLGQLD